MIASHFPVSVTISWEIPMLGKDVSSYVTIFLYSSLSTTLVFVRFTNK